MGRDLLGDALGTSKEAKASGGFMGGIKKSKAADWFSPGGNIIPMKSMREGIYKSQGKSQEAADKYARQDSENTMKGVAAIGAGLLAAPVIGGAMGGGAATGTTAATGTAATGTAATGTTAATQAAQQPMNDELLKKGFDAFSKNLNPQQSSSEDPYLKEIHDREDKQQRLQQAYANYGRMR